MQSAQPHTHQIDVMQRRQDGEGKGSAQARPPYQIHPSGTINLEKHDEDNRRQLRKGIGFPENARTKIAQPRNGVQNCTYAKNRNIAAEYDNSEFPWNLVKNGED